MNHRQLLAKRIGLVALTNLLVELNSLIMLPLLTKNLPVSEYGIWVQISVTIGLVPAVALMGLPYSMVRFLPSAKGKENIQEIFYSMAAVIALAGLVASVAIHLLAGPIADALFDGRLLIVKYLSLLIFLECLISIPFGYFRSVQRIKMYSIFIFLKVFFSLLLVIFFVLSGRGIFGAVIGMILSDAVILLAMSYFVMSDLGISMPRFKNIREYLDFGMPTIPSNLSSWIVNSSNRYVIGLLLGTTFVGYFSPSYTLGNMINLFIAPLSFALPAALSKHYDENDLDEVRAILGFSLKFFLAFGIPSAIGVSLLSRPILNVLSTPEIASEGYAITPFIAIGALFLGAYTVVVQILILAKKTLLTGIIWSIAALLNLVLTFFFVPHIGIMGAAIAALVAFGFAFFAASYHANRFLYYHLDYIFIIKSITASIMMTILLLLLKPEGTVGLLSAILAASLVYFAVLFLIKGVDKKEIDFFKNLFKF
ncbi:MAG: oligosaccharide flippase family protein [Methanothrix sp.]|nr:oligosaccharide flippase family protein [Methanothrix sp.]